VGTWHDPVDRPVAAPLERCAELLGVDLATVRELERDPRQPDRAEFAVAVADRYQGRGLGRLLLGRLVEAARPAGIRWLTGEVLANNHRMLHLLRHSGWIFRLRLSCGVVLVELSTWSSPDTGMIPAA
jgi:GNAT superfamily N-acetyltransferase